MIQNDYLLSGAYRPLASGFSKAANLSVCFHRYRPFRNKLVSCWLNVIFYLEPTPTIFANNYCQRL